MKVKMPRRPPGDGSVKWVEAKSHYLARLAVGLNERGNPARVSKAFSVRAYGNKTAARRAAEDWLSDRRQEKERGRINGQRKPTLREFAQEYFKSRYQPGRAHNDWKPKYHHEFSKFVERFVYPYLGDAPIDRITPLDVQRWVNLIRPTTTQYMTAQALFYLRLVFNQAEHLELILRNPAKRVRVARPPRVVHPRWTPDEVRRAMSYVETSDHPLRAYLHLALTTGMRREELLGLTWARVDLEGAYLDVQEVCTYVDGKWSLDPRPKSAKAARRVYLDRGTVGALRLQKERVARIRAARKADWVEMGLVFPSQRGTPWSEAKFYDLWDDLCARAEVTRIRPYKSRATWSTLTKGKLPDYVAAARAGHSPSVREEHYIISHDEEQRAAALPLEVLLGGNRGGRTGVSRAKQPKNTEGPGALEPRNRRTQSNKP